MKRYMASFLALTGLRSRQMLYMVGDALAGGVLGAALLTVLSEALKRVGKQQDDLWLIAAFAVGLVLYVVLQHFAVARMTNATELACENVRLRLLKAALNAPLMDSENTPAHLKRALLTRDAVQLAGAIPNWIGLLTSFATVTSALAYLAWLSLTSTLVVCAVILLAVYAYQMLIGRTIARMREAYRVADTGLGFADDLFLGTKELKLDPEFARTFVRDDLAATLRRARELSVSFRIQQHDVGLVGVVAFYGLTALAAFAFERWLHVAADIVSSVVVVLLFLQGHIQSMVQRLPALTESAGAQERVNAQLATWERRAEIAVAQQAIAALPPDWRMLRLESVSFSYGKGSAGGAFQLRDVSLAVPRGATVFIVGGNGSGKTTLAKLLLGLYSPEQGRLMIDDVVIDASQVLAYRSAFSSVFSDVHLFRRSLDMLPEASRPGFEKAMDELDLRLQFGDDGRLDVRALSQGQKKRVASAFALAEHRPLCLFDEWTADQDPEFRQYFYETFLPRLRAEGRTVFVITHDDRHFHRADMLVRLDGGRVVDVERRDACAAMVTMAAQA